MMPVVPLVLWTLQLSVSTLPPIHRSLYVSFSFDLAIYLSISVHDPFSPYPTLSLYLSIQQTYSIPM